MGKRCYVFWGTHGCDLEKGHSGPHKCDAWDTHSEYDEANSLVRHMTFTTNDEEEVGTWSEWMSGTVLFCPGVEV